jgi:hypothetical protein
VFEEQALKGRDILAQGEALCSSMAIFLKSPARAKDLIMYIL